MKVHASRPRSPFNLGQMCPKGLAAPEIMYHPAAPDAAQARGRAGQRPVGRECQLGHGARRDRRAWRASAASPARSASPSGRAPAGTTTCTWSASRTSSARRTGTSPAWPTASSPGSRVSNLTYGAFVGADYQGEVNPRTILFWGHNPIVSGADGELSFPVRRALERGSFGIAVDPRRIGDRQALPLWLPIRPGTDAALALAMAQVIIGEELYDREFVRAVDVWVRGARGARGRLHARPGRRRSPASRPADIAAAARRYAMDKPGGHRVGRGAGAEPQLPAERPGRRPAARAYGQPGRPRRRRAWPRHRLRPIRCCARRSRAGAGKAHRRARTSSCWAASGPSCPRRTSPGSSGPCGPAIPTASARF